MARRTPKNTRKHRRMTVRLLVDYQLAMTRGEIVKVSFRIPGGEELHELEARVTWYHAAREEPDGSLRTPGVGLQFTDPTLTAPLARELEDYAG
jgi:hypothetical protein